jgi:transcription elongation factor Elf1
MFACDDDIIESFLRSIPQMRVNAVIKQTNMRNKCFCCSQGGHYVSECPLRYPNHKKTSHCNRCGRRSHTITNCRAQLHINGKKLEKESLFFS